MSHANHITNIHELYYSTIIYLYLLCRSKFVRLDIDPSTITWQRVLDVCDRFLRGVVVGVGKNEKSPRETGFDITVASEVIPV